MKQRPLHSELNHKSSCTQKLYNLVKTKKLSLTSPMPMSQFQWCWADGKEHSITTKFRSCVIYTKPHKTELGWIASF